MAKSTAVAAQAGVSLVRGAAVLGLAGIISKVLGTLQKIPLQNIAGDEAFGIYNAVYPFYVLLLFLATAGFPIAVSKFVAERSALGDEAGALRVFRVCAAILTATGVVFFVLLYFGADYVAGWIANRHTADAIRSVSFALLIVPVMAALRGYFQGLQQMEPTAISQVAEQLIRVGTMVGLLLYFTHEGAPDDWIAAGATFGSVTGAAAGLAVMALYWRKAKRERKEEGVKAALAKDAGNAGWELQETEGLREQADSSSPDKPVHPQEPVWTLVKRVVAFAIPICLGSIVMPILNIVDTFTMPRLLKDLGFDDIGSMAQYGIYGRGQPLVQLIAMLASSISVALVPAIAEAVLHRRTEQIKLRAELAMRFTWLFGMASSVGLAVLAVPINVMLYADTSGTDTMAITAFTAVFSTANIISTSLLQGVGDVTAPARNLLVAAALKVALNVALVPALGIRGAAIAAVVAFAAATALNYIALVRRTGASFALGRDAVRPAVALLALAASASAVYWGVGAALDALWPGLAPRAGQTLAALPAMAAGAAVYGAALCKIGAVSEADLRAVPSVGRKALPLLKRLRLL